jgi:hypothetical protein
VNSYLIPQIVYVGDRAVLAVPLDHLPEGEFLFTGEPPALPELQIHRIELERRGEGGRLLINFTAYAPGPLELPPLEIGGIAFTGLRFEIASILDAGENAAVLSGPAPPLTIPGTGFLVAGTVTGIILIVLAFFWVFLRGPRCAERWLKKWRRRRLILSLAGMERRLRKELCRGTDKAPGMEKRLSFLAGEFRTFLTLFTGENCRAMTAGELSGLRPLAGQVLPEGSPLAGDFLGPFFRRCDDLRFSGAEIPADFFLGILEDLKLFVDALRADAAVPDTAGPESGGNP